MQTKALAQIIETVMNGPVASLVLTVRSTRGAILIDEIVSANTHEIYLIDGGGMTSDALVVRSKFPSITTVWIDGDTIGAVGITEARS